MTAHSNRMGWSPASTTPDGLALFDLDVLGGAAPGSRADRELEWEFQLEAELAASSLQAAVAHNDRYAASLGWGVYADRISQQVLGFTNMSPTREAFAEAMAAWQARNGLTPDGIVGPATWGALRRVLGITVTAAPPPASPGGAPTGLSPSAGRQSELITIAPEGWPQPASWLRSTGPNANCTPLQHAIVLRALCDDGIQETPVGSNRGERIDHYSRRAGLQPGGAWCAIWLGSVYGDCGALVPRWYPLTDYWLPHVVQQPCIGAAVLYGKRTPSQYSNWADANHIGIVAMLEPQMLTIEGNRGGKNGQAVALGPMSRRDVLGYVHPRRADGTR